jgi:hypothetical protein
MKKWATCLCALSLFISAACVSLAEGLSPVAVSTGDYVGKSKAEITEKLISRGYKVKEFQYEGDLIDAEVDINGVPYEIHVNKNSGNIVGIEKDD